jgi:putative ATPase
MTSVAAVPTPLESGKSSMDLFEKKIREYYKKNAPLADRMRPRSLDEFFGQDEIVGEGKFLRAALEGDRLPSLILWGPPGSGKTTLARIAAAMTGKRFVAFSAVTAGVKDVKQVIVEARDLLIAEKRGTILFIDEIHRFNKAQQDAFLHSVEDGTLILIGATTENPSFEVNAPLLSRCQVVVLKALGERELGRILDAALADKERGLGALGLTTTKEAHDFIVAISQGDGRSVLNFLELAALKAQEEKKKTLDLPLVETAVAKRALLYDKTGEEHYNAISALHKAMRGSDPDAALYWLGRMLEAGEDPLYVVRRMIRFASEDIGNADPQALVLAIATMQAVHFLGMPECNTALAQLAIYLSTAPKSNSAYTAYGRVAQEIQRSGPLPVPLHIRNAPTQLMKDLGYSEGYRYAHNYEEGYVFQEYLPDALKGKKFYEPKEMGFEREIIKRLKYWRDLADNYRKAKKDREG